jgi:methylamine dehydrogenase heavy chain
VIYSPETYFSRHMRGTRTDVVTIYDGRRLAPVAEVSIPPKRVSSMPTPANARLTDDDRFVLVYNFTPAQSITVVDTRTRKFAGEVDTAGCALVYPTGPRSFFSLCGDGAALSVRLDEVGKAASRARSAVLFDPIKDPVTEKGVRDGISWLFATFAGEIRRSRPRRAASRRARAGRCSTRPIARPTGSRAACSTWPYTVQPAGCTA